MVAAEDLNSSDGPALVPAAIVSSFLIGLFLLAKLTADLASPMAGRPRSGAMPGTFYAISMVLGHAAECGLALGLMLVGLVLWRRKPIRSSDLRLFLRAMAFGHVPMLVWLATAYMAWLPRTIEASQKAVASRDLAMDERWLSMVLSVFVLRHIAIFLGVAVLAHIVGRTLKLTWIGTIAVVFLPAVLSLVVEYGFLYLLQ